MNATKTKPRNPRRKRTEPAAKPVPVQTPKPLKTYHIQFGEKGSAVYQSPLESAEEVAKLALSQGFLIMGPKYIVMANSIVHIKEA